MKVLILGGAKFIGRAIAHAFFKDGHSVTLFTRGITDRTGVSHHHHIPGDRNNLDDLRRAGIQNWDVVVDNIGVDGKAMEIVLEAFSRPLKKRGQFLFTSSASVYSLKDHLQPVDESATDALLLTDLKQPGSPVQRGGIQKLEAERALIRNSDIPFTIFRPHRVLGPGSIHNPAFWYLARLMSGGSILLPSGGLQNLQFTFVNDLAEAYLLAAKIKAAVGRTYNIAQREITSLRDFLDESSIHLGIVPNYVEASSQWIGPLGGPFTKITKTVLDVSRATKELGLKLTSFEDLIRITADWFRDYQLDENQLKILLSNRRSEILLCRLLDIARRVLMPKYLN